MRQQKIQSGIKTGFGLAALTAITFSVVGGSASAVSTHTSNTGNAKSTYAVTVKNNAKLNHESKAAADLRVALNSLLAEHVTTNLTVNRSITAGASEAEINAGIQAQIANSNAISAAIGSIYGAEAEAQFSEMFLEHIEESNNFARAVAAGDESAKLAANEELQEYLMEISTFLSTAIPVLPYDAVYSLLLEHEALINQSTEAFETFNFGQSKKN